MAKVTAEIKHVLKEKDRGIATGAETMLKVLTSLHGQVTTELGKAALGSWDAYHLRQVLDQIEFQLASHEGQARQALSGLLDDAWNMGKGLVDRPMAAAGIYTGFHLSTTVLDTLKDYSSDYLRSLFQDAWYGIKGEITLGIVGNKTPQAVTAAIGKTIDSGRFKGYANRAETITKHEMGTVFSEASQLRMQQTAENVPGLEKEWNHAGHPKTARPSHVAAHGLHVPVGDPYDIGGVMMMFPRDPRAPLEETMNCGCDSVPYHANWQ